MRPCLPITSDAHGTISKSTKIAITTRKSNSVLFAKQLVRVRERQLRNKINNVIQTERTIC